MGQGKIPWYTQRLMNRKRVTCELHDSYFRLMTIKHAIPKTYIQQLCEDTECNPEDQPKAMNDWEKWRERIMISVLAARHDDDDDDC